MILGATLVAAALTSQDRPPNIIFIMADDLGYGELGSYGQTKIKTPNLDTLAEQGMRFTDFYTGAPVCAPARAVLMTGKHSGKAYIRGNKEVGKWGPDEPEGQWPIPADEVTIAELLKSKGYVTGGMGKWGLGGPGSSGHPNFQGFDHFYGYLCQRVAHNYYPTHLWRNHDVDVLRNTYFNAHQRIKNAGEGFDQFFGTDYAPDHILEEALDFISKNKDKPFFLYLPFVEPHLAMQPPHKHVEQYPLEWDENPYLGDRGYTPHPRPRAGYAAMISDLDENVGEVVRLIDAIGLGENTIIFFTSDNGATHDVGGVDTDFFNSTGGLRGRKGSVYEGGIRVPMIARWTGKIQAGTTTNLVSALEDVFPTLADLAMATPPSEVDGVSIVPTLMRKRGQQIRPHYVWEFHGYGGQKAVRIGDWKAVLRDIHKGNMKVQLFNLAKDINETTDVADDHPDIVAKAMEIFKTDRTVSKDFPMKSFDK